MFSISKRRGFQNNQRMITQQKHSLILSYKRPKKIKIFNANSRRHGTYTEKPNLDIKYPQLSRFIAFLSRNLKLILKCIANFLHSIVHKYIDWMQIVCINRLWAQQARCKMKRLDLHSKTVKAFKIIKWSAGPSKCGAPCKGTWWCPSGSIMENKFATYAVQT